MLTASQVKADCRGRKKLRSPRNALGVIALWAMWIAHLLCFGAMVWPNGLASS